MSEGFECDRCSATRSGSPDTMLLLGDGRPRDRKPLTGGFEKEMREGMRIGEVEFDLCQSCQNDLRAWWHRGGGEPEDIEYE